MERDGFEQARVADIVAEAGLAHGSFYTYFSSKRALFEDVAEDVRRQVLDAVQPTGSVLASPIEALADSNRRYLEVYRRNGTVYSIMEHLARSDSTFRAGALQRRVDHVNRVAHSIRRWQARGIADPTVDPRATAGALVSMMNNFAFWWIAGGDEYDEQTAVDALNSIWIRAVGLRDHPDDASPHDETRPARPAAQDGAAAGGQRRSTRKTPSRALRHG
jgi:AcrR family transcriptional regulator